MGTRGVYVVHYAADERRRLLVSVDGETVSMEKFVEMHTPIQVTNLTNIAPDQTAPTFIGLMIAEESSQMRVFD